MSRGNKHSQPPDHPSATTGVIIFVVAIAVRKQAAVVAGMTVFGLVVVVRKQTVRTNIHIFESMCLRAGRHLYSRVYSTGCEPLTSCHPEHCRTSYRSVQMGRGDEHGQPPDHPSATIWQDRRNTKMGTSARGFCDAIRNGTSRSFHPLPTGTVGNVTAEKNLCPCYRR